MNPDQKCGIDVKITSLGGFTEEVRRIREYWKVPKHNELWFRGEDDKYETLLRPKLYRPSSDRVMRSVPELLEIENDLYEKFERCGLQYVTGEMEDEDWDWYFLMQHHGGSTRLLDWSDGALMALHFALWPLPSAKNRRTDAFVYVLEPYRLMDHLESLPEMEVTKQNWKTYAEKRPWDQDDIDEWERTYLPDDEEGLAELSIPTAPCVLEFPHITRRVAAQRSRFIVLGTDPAWLAQEFARPDSSIKVITIEGLSIASIRDELIDSGITEFVIFPDLDGLGREIRQDWERRK